MHLAAKESIHAFFQEYPHLQYDVHVSRWERDALCVVRKYAMEADELLRVHVIGGSGTLSEVINGMVGLPNVQLAAYPYGNENIFLQYFGADKIHLFESIRSQVFSGTIPIDVIKSGHRHGIAQAMAGFESAAAHEGLRLYENKVIPRQNIAHLFSAVKTVFSHWAQGRTYKIDLDGQSLDGDYVSILIANGPVYARNMNPAVDAHPNDGILDVYLMKKIPRFARLSIFWNMRKYLSGNYRKLPNVILHHRGAKISVSSEDVMSLILDDNPFSANFSEFEVLPYAIDFVCPGGIDVDKLPRIYGKCDNGEGV
jgi:diacylglycerol kinase family enzyme